MYRIIFYNMDRIFPHRSIIIIIIVLMWLSYGVGLTLSVDRATI